MSKENLEKFDEEFINSLLRSKEGIYLEFKQKAPSNEKIAKTISSLENTEGGILIIGISDQRRIIGIDPEEEIFMIDTALKTYCNPLPNIKIEVITWIDPNPKPYEKEEKNLLKVHISRSIVPIKAKTKNGEWKIFKREGDHTITLI